MRVASREMARQRHMDQESVSQRCQQSQVVVEVLMTPLQGEMAEGIPSM
jgi:hypothetical protein